MQLTNEFVIDTDADTAWSVLTDLQRVAPCLPGATIEGRNGDAYLGSVKVRVGPISAKFSGEASFVEQDVAARTAVVSMAGKDLKGAGSAAAMMRMHLEPQDATSTRVAVQTDLDISGKMVQFGRGAMVEVSSRIIDTFIANLSRDLLAPAGSGHGATDNPGDPAPSTPLAAAGRASAADPGRPPAAVTSAPTEDALDLGGAVLGPLRERAVTLAPAVLAVLVALLVGRVWGRRSARAEPPRTSAVKRVPLHRSKGTIR